MITKQRVTTWAALNGLQPNPCASVGPDWHTALCDAQYLQARDKCPVVTTTIVQIAPDEDILAALEAAGIIERTDVNDD